jgi:hypothetical protein
MKRGLGYRPTPGRSSASDGFVLLSCGRSEEEQVRQASPEERGPANTLTADLQAPVFERICAHC